MQLKPKALMILCVLTVACSQVEQSVLTQLYYPPIRRLGQLGAPRTTATVKTLPQPTQSTDESLKVLPAIPRYRKALADSK
ncbi:unnamed protein product, partial [Iphiclides podalirius]